MSSLLLQENVSEEPPTSPSPVPTATLLGEKLVQMGIVSELQVTQALDVQSRSHARIGQILVDLGSAPAAIVGTVLARQFGVRFVDLLARPPDPIAFSLVTEQLIRDTEAIPVHRFGESLEVAMVDPLDVGAIDRIHLATGLRVIPALCMGSELLRTVNDLFDASTRGNLAHQELKTSSQNTDLVRLTRAELAAASQAPVVRLVDSIIEGALAARASDIHFEPQESSLRVRYRVDGTLCVWAA